MTKENNKGMTSWENISILIEDEIGGHMNKKKGHIIKHNYHLINHWGGAGYSDNS